MSNGAGGTFQVTLIYISPVTVTTRWKKNQNKFDIKDFLFWTYLFHVPQGTVIYKNNAKIQID